ncbi:hypothetical protein Vadar_031024 [Vaccinium darrowii]|uniref:Uncharacterized protein n=1 Tax=Vaccinium darrowii TaxID=229202 RepID=A0ACB7Y2V6_9ERIC|nr:hypothetical protein Vadar_031024 [Vaccinium darrowii]
MESSSRNLLSFPFSNISNFISVKLDSENYLLWRDQFMPFLECNDLFGYVDGSITSPEEKITDETTKKKIVNPEYQVWVRTDKFVLSCIKASLSPSTSAHVLGLQTSRQVWVALETLFQQQSQARLDHLRDRLQNIKKGTSSAEEYVAEIKSIADKLAAINHPVSDSELVTRTLNGLQHEPNYLPFVYAIENRERPPSFDDLRARLLVHEQRVNGLQLNQSTGVAPTGSQTAEIALVSHTNSQRFNFQRDNGVGGQYNRGGYGNRGGKFHGGRGNRGGQNAGRGNGFGGRGNGRNYSRDARGSERGYRNNKLECQICHNEGHTADRCNFRYSRNPWHDNRNNFDDRSSASSFAGIHLGPSGPSDSFMEHASTHWLADSAATSHMTNNPSIIQQPTTYAGNGQQNEKENEASTAALDPTPTISLPLVPHVSSSPSSSSFSHDSSPSTHPSSGTNNSSEAVHTDVVEEILSSSDRPSVLPCRCSLGFEVVGSLELAAVMEMHGLSSSSSATSSARRGGLRGVPVAVKSLKKINVFFVCNDWIRNIHYYYKARNAAGKYVSHGT